MPAAAHRAGVAALLAVDDHVRRVGMGMEVAGGGEVGLAGRHGGHRRIRGDAGSGLHVEGVRREREALGRLGGVVAGGDVDVDGLLRLGEQGLAGHQRELALGRHQDAGRAGLVAGVVEREPVVAGHVRPEAQLRLLGVALAGDRHAIGAGHLRVSDIGCPHDRRGDGYMVLLTPTWDETEFDWTPTSLFTSLPPVTPFRRLFCCTSASSSSCISTPISPNAFFM